MSGYYINWKANSNNHQAATNSDSTTSSKKTNSEITLEKNEDYQIFASNDTSLTINSKKSELLKINFSTEQKDTLKSKPKKVTSKQEKKPIDPKKDSKTSLQLGIFANCLFVFGIVLLMLVLSLSSFSYILYLLAMLSIIAALIFVIIGLSKAIKVLHYLKTHPEDNKENKIKAKVGFILNMFILTIPLAYLALIIFALGT